MAVEIEYSKYRLTKVVSIEEIVSADYVAGIHLARFPHLHKEAWEICFCMRNTMIVLDTGKDIVMRQKEAYFIRPGTTHDIRIDSDETRAFVISFTCTNPDFLLPLENRVITVSDEESQLFTQMKKELESTFRKNPGNLHLFTFEPSASSPLGSEQLICCCLEQLIILLLRDATRQDGILPSTGELKTVVQDYLIEQVNSYITAHLDECLSVESIAAQFHYSRTRFTTLYKTMTGKNISDVIMNCRMEYAKELLRIGDLSISEISQDSGFSSPQYFSHRFMKEVGCPPTEYRKKYLISSEKQRGKQE